MIAIAHDRDVDGLGCHAILHRYCTLNRKGVHHILADYLTLCSDIEGIRDVRDEEIVIADLGFSEGIANCLPLLKTLGKENDVKWFDHHDWSGVRVPRSISLHIDMECCAAELIAKNYMPDDDTSSEIAALARAQDFMEENETAWKLYDAISAGFSKHRIVKLLSEGIFWNDELEACYQKYQETKSKAYSYLNEHSKYYRVGDLTCILGCSKGVLSSTLATNYLLKKQADFAICTWPTGKMSFRRNNQDVDLKKIAGLFGGGGRESAAGGDYGGKVTEENYLKIFDNIMERVSLGYAALEGFRS